MKIKDLTLCGLFTAIIAVCAWISVPVLEISFTMQTFGIFLTLGLLGGRRGSIVCLCYLLLGAVGAPIFSGFRGGLSVLLGPTGGYILGFLASALVYWGLTCVLPNRPWALLVSMAGGMLLCYAFGSVWFLLVYTKGPMTLWAVLSSCVFPFLIPDGCKIALAFFLTLRLREKGKL